jgi:hypothetical protein
VLLSVHLAWNLYSHTGLFLALGPDYGLYVSQALVLQEGTPVQIYDRTAIDRHYKTLLTNYAHDPSYRPGTTDLWGTHVPYPPVFAWTMQMFARLPAMYGFIVWTALNLLVVLVLGVRIAHLCPQWDRPTIILLLFGSYPVVVTLLVGQFQIIVAWALAECFLALRTGKDWRAGLWLGVLLLKPHYGILVGLLLLWKQRWRAVLGVATAGLVLLGVSVAAVGLPTLMAYPQSFSVMAQFRGDDPYVMINWRSLLLEIRPGISDRSGVLLSVVLGLLTVTCTGLMWRGPWLPRSSAFPFQFSLLILATLLVNYHSHPYGAVLLMLPLAFAVKTTQSGKLSQGIALGAFVIPTLILTIGYSSVTGDEYYLHLRWASQLLKGFLFLLFVSLLRDGIGSTQIWAKNATLAAAMSQRKGVTAFPGEHAALVVSRPVEGRFMSRRR